MEFDNNTLSGIIENASPLVWVALISILKAVVVYFIGKWVIGLVMKAVNKIFNSWCRRFGCRFSTSGFLG